MDALISAEELKELKDKAQAWDIAWPALIFMDGMMFLNDNIAWHQTLKNAIEYYKKNREE